MPQGSQGSRPPIFDLRGPSMFLIPNNCYMSCIQHSYFRHITDFVVSAAIEQVYSGVVTCRREILDIPWNALLLSQNAPNRFCGRVLWELTSAFPPLSWIKGGGEGKQGEYGRMEKGKTLQHLKCVDVSVFTVLLHNNLRLVLYWALLLPCITLKHTCYSGTEFNPSSPVIYKQHQTYSNNKTTETRAAGVFV